MKKLSQGCTLDCFSCCKLNVYTENNEIVKVEADKNHPYTKGIMCKKGRSHLEKLHHKDRLEVPMIKEEGVFREISFDQAIDIIASKIKEYKDEFSSKSIMYYEEYGNGGVLKSIGEVFMNFLGGATKRYGGPCWSAGMRAQEYDFGIAKGHSLEDSLNSKNIFIWGKNPAFTNIHHFMMLKKAKQKGIKIIVIDPVFTETAKIADTYIQINPSSDGALAMAMTKIIIDNNLCDYDYINKYVQGFDEYKTYVDSIDLDELIEECGVDKEVILELVKLYTQKYSTIYMGYGMQKYFNGGNNIRIINALGAITGQIGYSGGGINYANKVYPQVLNTDPYESNKYADDRIFYTNDMANFIENSLKTDTPIKMMLITNSNMINQLGDLNNLKEAINKVEFKVCIDMFMTDTVKECDLFIPCTNTLETEDILYSSMSNPYITYKEIASEPKNKLMDEYYFYIELSKRLKMNNYPVVEKTEYLKKIIQPLEKIDSTINLEKIKNDYVTIHKPVAWKEKIFETPSKKIEIYSNIAKEDGNYPLPQYIRSKRNKGFRLLTNHQRDSISSQQVIEEKGLKHVYINENMAINLNIKDEETVILKSNQGSIQAKVKITNDVKDHIAMMYAGWWKKNSNPNYITQSGNSDMGGQVTYNETFIDIIKQN